MLNLRGIIRNFRLLTICAGIGIPAGASGADIQWAHKTVKGGFSVALPSINMDALVDEIATLKVALKHDKKLLFRRAEQKRMKGKDTVLSVLMPGGLLYAAYKKNAHARAVQQHALVSSQLQEITTDLVAFMTLTEPVMLAKR